MAKAKTVKVDLSAQDKAKEALLKAKGAALIFRQDGENPPQWRDFRGADLSGKSINDFFRDTAIVNGDFTGANLDEADFTYEKDGKLYGMVLQGCKFNGASLKGTNFAGCDLRWSEFDKGSADEAFFAAFDDEGNVIPSSLANIHEVKGI